MKTYTYGSSVVLFIAFYIIYVLYMRVISMHTYLSVSALGQVMLYVDGMNGVIHHTATIQWLYSLLASKVRVQLVRIKKIQT